MPRYDDRRSSSCTRLYVGHLSPRVRSRDLEDIFSRYGRIRDVDMKRDYAFVEFSDPRDADDAQYNLNGREIKGSRIVVEFSKGVPRGTGGSRDLVGRGPPPGSGRCFNCGIDGHWARDCKAGDWKNKCYRCGERGHIERNCQNSPKKLRRGRSYSRSPTPRRYRRSRSYSRSRSRSMSPVKRDRNNDDALRRSRSPRYSQSPERARSPSPSRGRKRSLTPEDRSPRNKDSPTPEDRSPRNRDSLTPEDRSPRGRESPKDCHYANGSDYSGSPRARSKSPVDEAEEEGGRDDNRSPAEENGRSRSRSPSPARRDGESPSENENRDSPRGSE